MSPAVPPLATVTAIAVRPPGSPRQMTPSTSFGDAVNRSLEIDCAAGTTSGTAFMAALAAASVQVAAVAATIAHACQTGRQRVTDWRISCICRYWSHTVSNMPNDTPSLRPARPHGWEEWYRFAHE